MRLTTATASPESRGKSRLPLLQLTAALVLSLTQPTAAQERGYYIQTPFLYQTANYCGPAALATVMRYWGHDISQYELAKSFDPFPSKGLSGAELKGLAKRHGFTGYSFSGQSLTIRDHIKQGRPVIVALHSSELLNENHFVVVVGWDPGSQEWIVQDPTTGPYTRYAARSFATRWQQADNWALLVLPKRDD